MNVIIIRRVHVSYQVCFALGFGLLEAGSVSTKNEVNIMVKNAIDVIFGGLTLLAFWVRNFPHTKCIRYRANFCGKS